MFDFKWMLSPWLIRVVFVLGCLGSIAGGAVILGVGLRDNDAVTAVSGIGLILLGPVVVRLVCESYIIWFRINETLNEMSTTLSDTYTVLYGEFVEDDAE